MTCKYQDCREPATVHLCRECAEAEGAAMRETLRMDTEKARRAGRAEGLREAARLAREHVTPCPTCGKSDDDHSSACDAWTEADELASLLLARAEEVEHG